MQAITIAGAGLAGLLAANMLRRHHPLVTERQPELPNNHHAVLRFRTEEVSRQLHIPFRKVRVFKSCDTPDPVRAAILYAKKVTGRYEVRSLIDLSPVDRFIAPPDLIAQMSRDVQFNFGHGLDVPLATAGGDPLISTIPMQSLMDLLSYDHERPSFVAVPGWTVTASILGCDMYVTRYLAQQHHHPYRISITGDRMIVEGTGELCGDPRLVAIKAAGELGIAPADLGEPNHRQSSYAKIGRLSPEDRRLADDFMFWATTKFNIYSLGRFATWRAGLLLDDLVNDILKIERWMSGSIYDVKRSL